MVHYYTSKTTQKDETEIKGCKNEIDFKIKLVHEKNLSNFSVK